MKVAEKWDSNIHFSRLGLTEKEVQYISVLIAKVNQQTFYLPIIKGMVRVLLAGLAIQGFRFVHPDTTVHAGSLLALAVVISGLMVLWIHFETFLLEASDHVASTLRYAINAYYLGEHNLKRYGLLLGTNWQNGHKAFDTLNEADKRLLVLVRRGLDAIEAEPRLYHLGNCVRFEYHEDIQLFVGVFEKQDVYVSFGPTDRILREEDGVLLLVTQQATHSQKPAA